MTRDDSRPGTSGWRIRTDRLELWPMSPEAAAALSESRDTAAQIIGVPLPDGWPGNGLLSILGRQAALGPDEAMFGVWLIVERETPTIVGDAGFHGPPSAEGEVEIGYSVLPERRGRGYATEAVEALIDWADGQPSVNRVVAGCKEDNEPSIRVLERLGFERDGRRGTEFRWRRTGP